MRYYGMSGRFWFVLAVLVFLGLFSAAVYTDLLEKVDKKQVVVEKELQYADCLQMLVSLQASSQRLLESSRELEKIAIRRLLWEMSQ